MAFKVIALAVIVAVALARPENTPSYGYGAPTPSSGPAKYDFNYAVNDPPSGNDYGHQEARDGPNTQGSYFVLFPDGRLQRVTYTVNGDSGYVAEVVYEGSSNHLDCRFRIPDTQLTCNLATTSSTPPPPSINDFGHLGKP
ncbi:pro-resilin-like [Penaeus japonicus]|uniref:pro-resilin-like n=1 Tax=Penaeus japonicus TaxID=27405 RepID=UPI001C710D18|nr:pro-resilin-like [Penaeus japonicus]